MTRGQKIPAEKKTKGEKTRTAAAVPPVTEGKTGTGGRTEWRCPRCRALPNECGEEKVHLNSGGFCDCPGACMGFICDCEDVAGVDEYHGERPDSPCPNAACYHCGWGGTFPPPPFRLKGWAKTAWEAGWRPPVGWTP